MSNSTPKWAEHVVGHERVVLDWCVIKPISTLN
jgi:hypothetical protein